MTNAIEKSTQAPAESSGAMQPSAPATPMQMIATHVANGGSIEQLERLYQLQVRYEENEARKAWNAGMNAFKANPPRIIKNKHVSFGARNNPTQYDHATLDEVANKISAAMAPHGLSFRWETDQQNGGQISVTCIVAHKDGHSERTTLSAGADQSGGKNNIQSIGSTVSYLQRYTLKAATGIAEAGQDDDGQASEQPPPAKVSQEQGDRIAARLAETETDRDAFLRVFARRMSCGALHNVYEIPAFLTEDAIQMIDDNAAKRAQQQKG